MIKRFLLASYFLSLLCSYSFAQQTVPNVKEDSHMPVVDYDRPELTDSEENINRKEKNKRYNPTKGGGVVPKTPPSQTVGSAVFYEDYLPPIPASESSVIVIGEIQQAEAHLSDDKRFVYSEYGIKVSEILKNNVSNNIVENSLLAVDVMGGYVRYSNGQTFFYKILGRGFPHKGRRYVLFLTAIHQNQDFKIMTGYELREGKVYPLGPSGQYFNGMNEIDFMKKLRDAVKQSSKANSKTN